MRKALINTVIALLVLILSLMGISCPQGQPAEVKTLSMGFLGPLSGPLSFLGLSMLRAVELGADEVNAAGGLDVDGDKYQVKIISYDDEFNPDTAVRQYRRLVDVDGVRFIFDISCDPGLYEIQEYSEKEGIFVMYGGWGEEALAPDKPLTFRSTPTIWEFLDPFYSWIVENNPEVRTVAFLGENTPVGHTIENAHKQIVSKYGIEVIASEFQDTDNPDFVPVLVSLIDKNPDAIDTSGVAVEMEGLALKQLSEMGWTKPVLGIGDVPALTMQIAGEGAEGFLFYHGLKYEEPVATPEQLALKDRYLAKFGAEEPFAQLNEVHYEGFMILANAIEEAGSLDTTEVAQAIMTVDYELVCGLPIEWGGLERYGINHQLTEKVYISQIHNGDIVNLSSVVSRAP